MKIEFVKVSELNEIALQELFDPKEEVAFVDLQTLPEEEMAALFAETKKPVVEV